MSINNIGSRALSNVLSYLQDRDVIAFGSTSKKMQDAVKQELERRDDTLAHLLSPYTITRTFNVQSLKEIKLFGIGEVHDNEECESTQKALINFLAWRGPVILIREEDAFYGYNEEDKNLLCDEKGYSFRENIYSIGWDDKKIFDALHEKQAQLNEVLDELSLLEQNGNEKELKYKELQEKQSELACLVLKEIAELGVLLSSEQMKELYEYDEEQIKELQNIFKISAIDVYSKKSDRFPIRTVSMINTLKKIGSFLAKYALKHSKIVLTAGCDHLERRDANMHDGRFDLDGLYQELKNHKAAIFLPTVPLTAHIALIQRIESEIEMMDDVDDELDRRIQELEKELEELENNDV